MSKLGPLCLKKGGWLRNSPKETQSPPASPQPAERSREKCAAAEKTRKRAGSMERDKKTR